MKVVSKSIAELTSLSRAEQKVADKLIEDGKVENTLRNFGKVIFTGSYSLGLMLDSRDIDIYVVNEKMVQKENARQALNQFILQNYFNGYHFYDWFQFHKDIFPKGYYVGLEIPREEKKWKFDIWFFDKQPEKFLNFIEQVRHLSEEKKGLILQMKYARSISQAKISAFDIYKIVLEDRVNTVDDFVSRYINTVGTSLELN